MINPATEQLVAVCPRASKAQLDQAVAAAKAAFPAWRDTPIAERKAKLVQIAEVIEANAAELARLLTQEQGKPIGDATGEVYGAAAFFRYFTSLDLPVKVIDDSEGRKVEAHRRPLGVIGAIVPWNFPLILMAFKVPAALLAGNTVVLKPAATTPLSTLRLAALIKDILPAGVLNVIADANDLGGALTAHPDVRKVSFTGSTATGKKVMAGAADALKRITLELGGNDAGIVLSDVDPKTAAPKIFQGAFQNSGQVCIALKRLYVHESIYDAMCAELAQLADAAVMGDGLEQGTQIGPLQNKMQYDKVRELIEDARQDGKIIAGGVPRPARLFHPPDHRARHHRRLAPGRRGAVRAGAAGDQVRRRRGRPGPGQQHPLRPRRLDLVGRPRPRLRPGRRMDSGTVWINKHSELAPNIPFGGAKQSGIGVELGEEGLAEFTQLQVINMAR